MRKLTKGQQAVLEVLERGSRPLSAQEIFLELRGTEQEIGLATVYRSLETLQTSGRLQSIDVGDNQSHYLIGKERHGRHHLICLACKRVVPLDHCPVGDLETHLADDHQFQIAYHVLDFYGTCTDCYTLAKAL
jgi:Fur family transcriptional regulator, ferric uptake regulator